jgi:hypothetical protein
MGWTEVKWPKPPGAVKASDSKRGYADSLRLPPTPGSSNEHNDATLDLAAVVPSSKKQNVRFFLCGV